MKGNGSQNTKFIAYLKPNNPPDKQNTKNVRNRSIDVLISTQKWDVVTLILTNNE